MFDRAWLDTEIAGLERQAADALAQYHQVSGALAALHQMRAMLITGAGNNTAPTTTDTAGALSLNELGDLLPDGYTVDTERGIAPHED